MNIDPAKLNPAIQRYLYLARHFHSHAPASGALHFLRGKTTYARSEGLIELRDATVLAAEWFVIVNDRVLCDFFLQTPRPPLSAYLIQFDRAAGAVELLYEPSRNPPIAKAFLLGGCFNYSHWLLDYLPRLRLCGDTSLPLLVNQSLTPFQLDSLRFLGVDDSRLLRLNYPEAYSIRHLFYPSICSSSIMPPHSLLPGVLDWLRKVFAPLFASDRRDRRIFISRAGEAKSHRRRLINQEEIAGIAQKHGFEIKVLEQLSFIEQVRLFSQASVIAGAHGAGFTNMIFAPKGAKLLELIGPRLSRSELSLAYVGIAKLLQQNLIRIVGRSVEQERESMEFDHVANETYAIEPQEFERLLRD